MKPLRIGAPARGSKTGRPVMVLLDLLGRRMALRILWELRERRLTFRDLAAAAGTNPSVLNGRLHELRDVGLIDHRDGGYRLTEDGAALVAHLLPLLEWSERWSQTLGESD